MNKYLGIDVGGTAIKFGYLDEQGTILESSSIPTPTTSLDDFMNALDSIVNPIKDTICGIAMSMPGKIDNKTGFMYTGGALSAFISNLPLGQQLSKRYNMPVTIENDAKCAALAELWKGALKDVSSGVTIILGTGIGGGIVLNNKVWRGFKGSAGEISILPSDYHNLYEFKNFWAMRCGYPGLTVPYAINKGLDPRKVNGIDFFEAYHQNDQVATAIFENYTDVLLSGIIAIQTVLDVEKICIGGGISAQDVLIERTRQKVDEYFEKNPQTPLNKPVIDRCQYKNDANLIGALKNHFDVIE